MAMPPTNQAADDRPEAPGLASEQILLNRFLEKKPNEGRRQEGGDDVRRHFEAFRILPHNSENHLTNPRKVKTEDGNDRSRLNANCEGIRRRALGDS